MTQQDDLNLENEEFDDESGQGKQITFRVVAELSIPEDWIQDDDPVETSILGEYIKVKSGLYENILSGFVVSVEKLSDDSEETCDPKSQNIPND